MLADLFNDPNNDAGQIYSSSSQLAPPSKRKETNLCGIRNQGATCYLNTLIQTLFHTKEFRESLFSLTGEELGLVPSKNGQQAKLRIIPIELQRLFGQLLILDQESCSTNKLTESFGWSNNEELQQHDVQELNRILFSAIEQSLVNTKQSKLIQELYKGTCMNKVRCLTCLNVFEREEEFLDLPITVQGSFNLYESLSNSYILRENLNGNNQYKCEKCNNQYRDAEKYCQLKTLPPILTFSLLRFTYDLKTFQRIKETGKFEFPLEIDLKDYMEDSIKTKLKEEYTKYELFSVIIHSGSAYGGHYHCYIKDFDNLGKWVLADEINKSLNSKTEESNQEEKTTEKETNSSNNQDEFNLNKEICLICCDDDENSNKNSTELVNLDYLKYDKPLELLKAFIYNKIKYDDYKIENLCSDLTKVTGVSWNKRFKNKYGPIEKFLRKNDDNFEVSQDGRHVKLKPHDRINLVSSKTYNSNELIEMCLNEVDQNAQNKISKKPEKKEFKPTEEDLLELDANYHWYDFDDSRVTPIFSSRIRQQFDGKESAYMLFYRKKSKISNSSLEDHTKKLPNWLIDEINKENINLNLKREEYENTLNLIKIECYLESDFYLEQDVLNLKHQFENKQFSLNIDKRNTVVNDLQEILVKYCTEQESANESNVSDYSKEMQHRKETSLQMLFDDKPSYWLLVQRIDTSSSGRFNYFVKSCLTNPNENLFKLISSANKSSNFILVFSKHNDVWPIGDDYEPIRIIFKFFDKNFEIREISYVFTKSTLIKKVKEELSSLLINEQTNYELGLTNEELNALSIDSFTFNLIKLKPTSIINKTENQNEKIILESSAYDQKSLKELGVKNGDFITIESEADIDKLFNKKSNESKTNVPVYSNRIRKINVINCLLASEELKSGNLSTNSLSIEESDSIKNIHVMALSSFEINTSINDSHLRFLNEESMNVYDQVLANFLSNLSINEKETSEISFPGNCLHDDSVLGEIIEPITKKNNLSNDEDYKFIFLLCPGKAPLQSNNEIMVKCHSNNSESFVEILVELSTTRVSDLTQQIIHRMKLKPCDPKEDETYYLKKLDWFGDVEGVLNAMLMLCSEVGLRHNQSLMITKGKLIPPNHLKLKIWIPFEFLKDPVKDIKSSSTEEKDEIIINDFIDTKCKNFKVINEVIIANDTKLEDLKSMIQNTLIDRDDILPCNNLRLRVLKKQTTGDFKLDSEIKFQMKKPLIEWHKPLKQFHLNQESDIGIELLDEEDDRLNQGIMLINCIRYDLKSRLCSKKSYKQIFWNINNGATLNSLKESIVKAYSDELSTTDAFRMHIAKRIINKYQFILLKDTIPNDGENKSSNAMSKKKKKSGNASQQQQSKTNLKQAPYHFDDGDFIAFTIPEQSTDTTSNQISAQDFLSTEDLEYAKKQNMTAAELSRLRKEKKFSNDDDKKKTKQRRPEVGITIKIDDFTEN